jgi:hypothetical protein
MFQASVIAAGHVAFQWMRNGVPLRDGGRFSGVSTGTLAISNVEYSDTATYRVQVTAGCNALSADAQLWVRCPTLTVLGPADATVSLGEQIVLESVADAATPVSYQWYKEGQPLAGSERVRGTTSSTLTIENAASSDAGRYRCLVIAECGSSADASASVQVSCFRATFVSPSRSARPGESVSFRVEGIDFGLGATYMWLRNGAFLYGGGRISETMGPVLRIDNVEANDSGVYQLQVTVSSCSTRTWLSPQIGLSVIIDCPADFNDDGFADFFDFNDFVRDFEQGTARADFNADGFIDFFDFDDFIAAFEQGC